MYGIRRSFRLFARTLDQSFMNNDNEQVKTLLVVIGLFLV